MKVFPIVRCDRSSGFVEIIKCFDSKDTANKWYATLSDGEKRGCIGKTVEVLTEDNLKGDHNA